MILHSGPPVHSTMLRVEPLTAVDQQERASLTTAVSSSSSEDDPIYSKVMKVKPIQQQQQQQQQKQQQQRHQQQENPYSEPTSSFSAPQFSNVVTRLDFSSLNQTSDIVQIMSDAAANDIVMSNDSLYDSLRERQSPCQEEGLGDTEVPQYNSAVYKGLRKHEQDGNIHLIAIRGISDLPESANLNFNHGGSPGMLPIHYAAGSGDKKALKAILSALPLRQDPVEHVRGSRRLCWREGVDEVDEEKRTALMHAVHGNHFDCVTLLVEAGANISAVAAGVCVCVCVHNDISILYIRT